MTEPYNSKRNFEAENFLIIFGRAVGEVGGWVGWGKVVMWVGVGGRGERRVGGGEWGGVNFKAQKRN